ncbi:MAG: 3-isopropylmalate dehydratase small subunit [Fimbriimonadaceae bacterium]|nr:3-isopropylmalate dehydratase small subunit [Alphaproteobacteria bacterium]
MTGRVWKFGDNINTDLLAPGAFMKGPVEELAKHCLEAVDADFAAKVEPGDILVAGHNFGMGSSREQAAQVLVVLGISAVIAKSFAGIFYRNAFNLGLPALISPDTDRLTAGDKVIYDMRTGILQDISAGLDIAFEPIPDHLAKIVAAGGLIPYLEHQLETRS